MVDEVILTPGCRKPIPHHHCDGCLIRDNLLSEFSEAEKEIVRYNLGVPSSDEVYTRAELESQITEVIIASITEYLAGDGILDTITSAVLQSTVRTDGSTPFTAPQAGVTPVADADLTTKLYVDSLLAEHLKAVDPHGIKTALASEFAKYALADNVYDKETVDKLISLIKPSIDTTEVNTLIKEAIKEAIGEDGLEGYVKTDGSTPFTAPQKGVDAVEDADFVTLKLLNDKLANIKPDGTVDPNSVVWLTNGAVLTTVGLVNDNTNLPNSLTFQLTMDAIFYGFGANISVDPEVIIGETVDITVSIDGGELFFKSGVVYQDDEIIHTLSLDELNEDNEVVIQSNPIYADSVIKVVVTQPEGYLAEVSETIECVLPAFIGLGTVFTETITLDEINTLVEDDPTNNKIFASDTTQESITYEFADANSKVPIVLLPSNKGLLSMSTTSLIFGATGTDPAFYKYEIQFDALGTGSESAVKDYYLYVYKEPLTSINLTVTFKFSDL